MRGSGPYTLSTTVLRTDPSVPEGRWSARHLFSFSNGPEEKRASPSRLTPFFMPSPSSRSDRESYRPSETVPAHARTPRHPRRRLFMLFFLLAFAAAVATSAYYFVQYHRLKNDPTIEARKDAERVVGELSRLMIVPDDPAPVLATVSDRDQLQDQPFFRSAENGDQVVIFPSSMKAVLYRPGEKRIVDIAPLVANASAPEASPPPVSPPAEEEETP